MIMVEITDINDIDALMSWRREVIESVFGIAPDSALIRANRDYYRDHMACGDHFAVEATVNGFRAGCGGVCFHSELPSPDNPLGLCGYIMNVYVRPEFRRQGTGNAIVGALVEAARRRGCGKIYLESTEKGRSLYLHAGFRAMNDMMKL